MKIYIIGIITLSFGIILILDSKNIIEFYKVSDDLTESELTKINARQHKTGTFFIIMSLIFLFIGISILF